MLIELVLKKNNFPDVQYTQTLLFSSKLITPGNILIRKMKIHQISKVVFAFFVRLDICPLAVCC